MLALKALYELYLNETKIMTCTVGKIVNDSEWRKNEGQTDKK